MVTDTGFGGAEFVYRDFRTAPLQFYLRPPLLRQNYINAKPLGGGTRSTTERIRPDWDFKVTTMPLALARICWQYIPMPPN